MEGRGSRGNRSSGRRERGPRAGNRHNNQGDNGEFPEENVSRNGPEQNEAQQQSWQHDLYDTRERRGGRRDPYQNGGGSRSGNNVLEGIERGIVCAVKDGFGFIESIDRETDLFFHFTELPPEFSEEVKKGLEVEYQVATDRRSGKVSAVNLRILPPGSVVFEELSLDRYRGVVSKELSTKRQYQTEATGMIDTKLTDGSVLGLPFAAHDIENSKLVLRNGDEVEFNILLQKKQQQQIATVIRVVKFAGERETGIVNNILEDKGFGFINCCDRDARLYFHFSELMCPEEGVTSGTEVEFTVAVDKRSDKISATRIFPLPKGTVTFETMLEERITGIVDTELSMHFDSRQKERQEEPGIIVVKTASPTETTEEAQPSEEKKYFFRSKDLSESRMRLRPGDEVEFNPLIEKRTKKLFGTKITLIRAAPEVREQGVVASIKNSNGFIASVGRLEEVAFHLSEFEDYKKQQRIEAGTEVEFAIVADNRSGKMRAVNIKLLPKGTVSFEEVIDGTHVGKVIKEATRGGRSGAKDEEGIIEYEEQEDGVAKKVQIPFPPKTALRKPSTSGAPEPAAETPSAQEREAVTSDEPTTKAEEQAKAQALISASSSYLVPGDTVEFSIAVEKRTKARRATSLKLLEEAHLQREKGYVCKVKPKSFSGYLRSSTPGSESGEGEAQKPGEQYFFYYSDVKKSGKTREEVKLGLPVEFSVFPSTSSSSQPRAVRIVVLQQELVAFEDVLEGPFHGVIEKDLRRKKSGPKESSPGIVAHILENGEKETLEYTETDVSERGLKLRVGESVDFTIAMDKFSKARRATNLKRGKQKGIVKSVKGSFGFIERYDKLAKEQLFFHMSRDLTLRVGDEVEFMVVFNDKKEDINAQNIIRLKEGPEPIPISSSSLSSDTGSSNPVKSKLALQRKANVETPLVSILRNPRMPDPKSKGFSPEARAANGISQAQPTTPAAPTPVVDNGAATPSSDGATV